MFKYLKSSCALLLIGGFLLAKETQAASVGATQAQAPAQASKLNQPYHNVLEDLLQEASHLQTQSVLAQNKPQSSSSAKEDLVSSIKKLKEQSELYQMINDMLKAESQVQKMPYTMDEEEYEDDEGHHDEQDHDHHEEEVAKPGVQNVQNNRNQHTHLKPATH